jgi:hypothetical protein
VKPGDLVTIRRWNLTHRVPIAYVNIYDRIDGDEEPVKVWKWEHGERGVLLEGRDERQEMAQVLHKGRIGWVDEEYLRVVDETR